MRMKEIILGLLDLANVGKNQEVREQVEMNEIFQKVVFLQKRTIVKSNAQITWDEKMPVIDAPKNYMIQIFNELVSNSLKFHNPNESPLIRIFCQEEENWVQFEVHDNGIGFDPSESSDPFLMFSRLHPQNEAKGLGIGLAIVRKIAEQLRGTVWFISTPGKGSVFYLKIPKAT